MRTIQRTLLEQMRIDKIELANRQAMFGFSQKDADLLAWCEPMIKDGISSLVADFYERLTATEEVALSLEDEIAERTSRLRALSHQDSLTGLHNRRALCEVLRRDLREAERSDGTLSLVYFDVARLREINDRFGHERGDELLVAVAHALRSCSRQADPLCRVGSDEFCVVLRGCDSEEAEAYCERLLAELQQKEPEAELSFGIAQSSPDHRSEPDALLSRASDHMHRAKRTPGSRVVR